MFSRPYIFLTLICCLSPAVLLNDTDTEVPTTEVVAEPQTTLNSTLESSPLDQEDMVNTTLVGNGTESNANKTEASRKVLCAAPEAPHTQVVLVNASQLSDSLSPSRNECSLVIFYAPSCIFCAKSAPYLNGIARFYPNISVMAVNINESNSLNMKYGIVAVPMVLLMHNIRPVAKLNHTNTSLESLASFIEKHTGIQIAENLTLAAGDMEGPLATVVAEGPDWMLVLAWLFTWAACLYYLLTSSYASKTYNWFVATWREAEQAGRPHQD